VLDGKSPTKSSPKILLMIITGLQDRLSYARDGYPFLPDALASSNTPPPLYVNITESLPPFTAIHACLPFIFVIAPAPPTTYAIKIDGEEAVQDAIHYVVGADILVLSTAASFNTSGMVKLTVGPFFQISVSEYL
jgi:hypothetical protein